ncbi:MAG: hypothetical protein FWD57_13150, partial [Polyangiaceae bacterium]|nr:hypothetical protein [Polyangiaceae bacterium]
GGGGWKTWNLAQGDPCGDPGSRFVGSGRLRARGFVAGVGFAGCGLVAATPGGLARNDRRQTAGNRRNQRVALPAGPRILPSLGPSSVRRHGEWPYPVEPDQMRAAADKQCSGARRGQIPGAIRHPQAELGVALREERRRLGASRLQRCDGDLSCWWVGASGFARGRRVAMGRSTLDVACVPYLLNDRILWGRGWSALPLLVRACC